MTLKITAHLQNGFAASDPWSPSIDAILGYWLMRERMGEEAFEASQAVDSGMSAVEGLPLEVERHGTLWWYICSSPIYDTQAEFLRYFHRRFDVQHAEQYMIPKKGRANIKAGPHKNFRLSSRVIVTPAVTWHAEGDRVDVQSLLRRCHWIGSKTGAGNGRVLRWDVTEDGDPQIASQHRPIPDEAAEGGGVRMIWGFRPPGRLRDNQALCVMPVNINQSEELK